MIDKTLQRVSMALLIMHGRVPDKPYRAMCRAYGYVSDRRLRWQAGQPRRYRLMVADGDGPAVEWTRFVSQYQIPIWTVAGAVERLREAERMHPEYAWWIAPGDGRRQVVTFEEAYAPLLAPAGTSDRSEHPGTGD